MLKTKQQTHCSILVFITLLLVGGLFFPAQAKADEPVINIWYGHHQVFGHLGISQQWVNILGEVSNPEDITALTYSLNGGGEHHLSVGPDKRRLALPGEFNIELALTDLNQGLNSVVITALDSSNNQAIETVTIEYVLVSSRSPPFTIDWSSMEKIQDAVQIVDGLWVMDENGIRTHPDHVGYDRVVAIGDISWRDYEVTVPITLHAIDETAFGSPISVGPGIGILLRWQGHTDLPVVCPQPHCGWEPGGGSIWYEVEQNGPNKLSINAGPASPPGSPTPSATAQQFEIEHTYWFKMRVETIPTGGHYRLKVWEDGVESEPSTWTLQKLTTTANLAQGSFLLIAHHVDATFGNITVMSLAEEKPDG